MKTDVWYCDTCAEAIDNPGMGMVVWDGKSKTGKQSFAIIHKGPKCDDDRDVMWMELRHMIGEEGPQHLLSFLSYGPLPRRESRPRVGDVDGFVDLFRRLHTPGYEEARRYFDHPDVVDRFSGANEFAAYTPESLEWIIETGRAEA